MENAADPLDTSRSSATYCRPHQRSKDKCHVPWFVATLIQQTQHGPHPQADANSDDGKDDRPNRRSMPPLRSATATTIVPLYLIFHLQTMKIHFVDPL
eukprot:9745746-Heterocapsa_arctica.AAC.1